MENSRPLSLEQVPEEKPSASLWQRFIAWLMPAKKNEPWEGSKDHDDWCDRQW